MRDTNLTIEEVRKIISKIETNKFIAQKNNEKLNLISNKKFMNEYFQMRRDVIKKYSNDKEKVKGIVNKKLKKIFFEKFQKKNEQIKTKCNEIHEIEKRRTWIRLKRYIFMNRIMEYKSKKSAIRIKRIQSLGNKSFFIPHQLDVSYRDMENPNLKKSAFYELIGLFDVKVISPEYALRFSTSSSNTDFFKYLEINKSKLDEIKSNLLKNPNKFIDIWNSVLEKEIEESFKELEDISLNEYEKIYRMKHEGHSTLDKLPYYKEYCEIKEKWLDSKRKITELLRKITIDTIHDIIEKQDFYSKSLTEAIKDEEKLSKIDDEKLTQIKELYNILKTDNSNDLSYFNTENNSRQNILKLNFQTSIEKDPIFKSLHETQFKYCETFRQKVMDLTQNVIINNLVVSGETNNLSAEDIKSNFNLLFDFKSNDSSSCSNDFIDWLYIKYSTQNIFSEILKKSKSTVISLLKSLVENELFVHNNSLLSEVKENKIDLIKAIYNKEKLIIEDVLKDYYELKLKFINLDLVNKIENGKINLMEIENCISHLKDLTLSHIILNNSAIPTSLNLLLSEISEYKSERQFVELYVSLKDMVHSNLNETKFESSNTKLVKSSLDNMTKLLKSFDWFRNVEDYINKSDSSKNLDTKIEKFFKLKFNDILYENKIDKIDFMVDKRKLNEIIKEKFDIDYLRSLIQDYVNDKIKLDESQNEEGIYNNSIKLREKIDFYVLQIEIKKKISATEKKYNIENLKNKYSDYIINSNFFIHKILCNTKNPEEIFKQPTDIQEKLNYGKFLLELKFKLDEYNKPESSNFNSSSMYINRLKTLIFNHKNYVDDLENLNHFINNKLRYSELIIDTFYNDPRLSFTNKYEINLLLDFIRTDTEKLFNHIKNCISTSKKFTINRDEFIIDNSEFFQRFKNLNFDEFIGLEGENFDYISELSQRVNEIYSNRIKEKKIESDINIENYIRKLITYEVMKGKNLTNDNNVEDIITEVIEKERIAYDDLIKSGKLPEDIRYELPKVDRNVYLNELVQLAEICKNDIEVINPMRTKYTEKNPVISSKFSKLTSNSSKIKNLSTKIFTTIQGLKHVKYIENNSQEIFKDPSNMYMETEHALTLSEFIKKVENKSLKFSNLVDIIFGKKFSIQELIVDDKLKTFSDYTDNLEFNKLFSKKLPVELIQTTLDVLDARLIKALKLVLTCDDKINVSEYIEMGGSNYLDYKPNYIRHQITEFVETLKEIQSEDEVNFENLCSEIEGEDEQKKDQLSDLKASRDSVTEVEENLKKVILVDSQGEKVICKYKKKSLVEKIFAISSMSNDKRNELETKIIKLVQQMVPLPVFSSQYTLLKYIYDYHMGTLQVAYENTRNEAEQRIIALNNTLFLEKIEKLEKLDPLVKKSNKENFPLTNFDSDISIKDSEINFEKKNLSTEVKEYHINENNKYLYEAEDELDRQKIKNYRNLAYNIFINKEPQFWNWQSSEMALQKYSYLVQEELKRYYEVYAYYDIKNKGNIQKVFNENKANAIIITEDFRNQMNKVKNSNKNSEKLKFNLHNENGIGFENQIMENNENKNHQLIGDYDKFFDDLLGEYQRNKKESLQLVKDKIKEERGKYFNIDNIIETDTDSALKKSQQTHYEMKASLKNEETMKYDIDTYLKMSSSYKEYPTFDHTDITDIIDLDNATSQAILGKYASIPVSLINESDKNANNFHFNNKHFLDKNEEEWFEDQIENFVNNFLEKRNKIEKSLTRNELLAIDYDLKSNFSLENIISHVNKNLNQEILALNFLNNIFEYERNSESEKLRQQYKTENKQFEYNKKIKDEDAYYQHHAYMTRLDNEMKIKTDNDLLKKKNTTGSKKVDKNIIHPAEDITGFEYIYAKDLLFNQIYKERKENSENFEKRFKSKEVNNLGRTYFFEASTRKEKFEQSINTINYVERKPERIDLMNSKKASDILTIFKEKAHKIDQIDRFNQFMTGKNGIKH